MFERILKYFKQIFLKKKGNFIIYQKLPFRRRIVPGRLHSELCACGVKMSFWLWHKDKSEVLYSTKLTSFKHRGTVWIHSLTMLLSPLAVSFEFWIYIFEEQLISYFLQIHEPKNFIWMSGYFRLSIGLAGTPWCSVTWIWLTIIAISEIK